MSQLEHQVSIKNIEQSRNNQEHAYPTEVEHKLVPQDSAQLERLFKSDAYPITQLYVSLPHDKASLRVRASHNPEGVSYSAAYKSRGEVVGSALSRVEVETEISKEAFERYKQLGLPGVNKLRADIAPGMHVDFYDNPAMPVLFEVEHSDPEIRSTMVKIAQEMAGSPLIDQSTDPSLSNESIAWQGRELPPVPETLEAFTQRVLADTVAQYVSGKSVVRVGLTGLSGSGKSTVARRLKEEISSRFGERMTPVVLSTDDYHYGKQHLEAIYGAPYSAWDAAQTYNLDQLASDIEQLSQGVPVPKRHFDFEAQEPVVEDDYHLPSPFIFTEGIHARNQALETVNDRAYDLPTSTANSLHWDLSRLFNNDRASEAFPTYASRLRHLIEDSVIERLEQKKPAPYPFSASIRPLADRAFMLYGL